ncbi:MAG: insulinase family protein [Bryobacterales bacterium]|nr:insulinase family protein [Bryobacterales bacterium]
MTFRTTFMALLTAASLMAGKTIAQPGKSPLITFRFVFQTGAASDPKGKEGLASLTAAMLADGGSKKMTYQQRIDALFPMAASIGWSVDKEMTTFSAETHVDNLEKFYGILRDALLNPGWREDDLRRLKDDMTNGLRIALRSNNIEELGKEVLYSTLYKGHPYEHHNVGRVAAIQSITPAELEKFYKANYTVANLTIAIAGGYPADFAARVEKDFSGLAKGKAGKMKLPAPAAVKGRHLVMVEKQTRSVAISFGFPIAVKRGDADFVPLLVAQSWLGQHRNSGVRLFDRIREKRGLNYGDYAYIEYFPEGMYRFEPEPNLARQQQIFQIWIRPVQPETAHFALRLGIFELERLVREGMTEEDVAQTKNFLAKYVNLLTKTKRAELGYAIDSQFYGIGEYNGYLKGALAKVTREDVNRAIRKHLTPENMVIAVIGQDTAKLRDAIVGEAVSPMQYNSPKPEEILQEDKIVEKMKLGIKAANARIVKVETLFE